MKIIRHVYVVMVVETVKRSGNKPERRKGPAFQWPKIRGIYISKKNAERHTEGLLDKLDPEDSVACLRLPIRDSKMFQDRLEDQQRDLKYNLWTNIHKELTKMGVRS